MNTNSDTGVPVDSVVMRLRGGIVTKNYSIGRRYENGVWVFDWKPIATAPKDGTVIRFRNEENGLEDIGRWDRGEWTTDFGNGDMTHWTEA
jgi:hypothetical protein